MDIFDPADGGVTQPRYAILPEHEKYTITGALGITTTGPYGAIIRQELVYDIFRLCYYVFLIEEGHLLRAVTTERIYPLNFVLQGHLKIISEGQIFTLRKGQFGLLSIPEGSYDVFFPAGVYRYFQMEIRPDIISEFLPGTTFTDAPMADNRSVPSRYGDVSPNISVKGWHLLERIISNKQTGVRGQIAIESAAKELMPISFEQLQQHITNSRVQQKRDLEKFEEICSYIVSNLDKNITIKLLCDEFAISKSRLYIGFRQIYQESIHDYIICQKIEKAKLLLSEQLAVSDVAVRVGFSNTSSFIRAFKQKTGITPAAFRPPENGTI